MKRLLHWVFPFVLAGCAGQNRLQNDFIQENIDNAGGTGNTSDRHYRKIWQNS